jgi:hypothetical protein
MVFIKTFLTLCLAVLALAAPKANVKRLDLDNVPSSDLGISEYVPLESKPSHFIHRTNVDE